MNKKSINLIPAEMLVSPKSIKSANNLNRISTILAGVLIVSIVIIIGVLVFYNSEYKKHTAEVEDLKAKVVTLENSEQKLILAKDKLSKIAYINSLDLIDDEISKFQAFQELSASPSSAVYDDIVLGPQKSITTISFPNLSSISQMLSLIPKFEEYKKVTLLALDYGSLKGYVLSLLLED